MQSGITYLQRIIMAFPTVELDTNYILEQAYKTLVIYNRLLPDLLKELRKVTFENIEDEEYGSTICTGVKVDDLPQSSFDEIVDSLIIADLKSLLANTKERIVLDARGLFMFQDDEEGLIHFKRYYKENE